MSQSPFATAKASGPAGSDAPDLLFILRHYFWWILIGTLLGLAIGLLAYVVVLRVAPRYTAYKLFQVIPQANADIFDRSQNAPPTEDDTKFIKRQNLMVKRQEVINRTLESEFFHASPRPLWVANNAVQLQKALGSGIEVAPEEQNTGVFRIAFTAQSPGDATAIVKALSDVYVDQLGIDETQRSQIQIERMRKARDELVKEVSIKQDAVEHFRIEHDIPGLVSMNTQKSTTLGAVEADLIKAQVASQQARDNFEAVKKQVGEKSLQLSPEMEQLVESDTRIQGMRQAMLGLQQDRAVTIDRYGEQSAQVRAIDIRIATTQKQLQDQRDDVTQHARERMQEQAEQFMKTTKANEEDLTRRRNDIKTQVDDLDRNIVEYNNKIEDLGSTKKLLDDANTNLTRQLLINPTDAQRVRPFSDVYTPTDVSSPVLYIYLFGGFVIGAAVSLGLSYVSEVTNTRVRTPRDITRTMQMPLLGFVPDQEDDAQIGNDLMTSIRSSPTSMIAESFRQIRGKLAASANGQLAHGSLLIAPIDPGAGATTVASNLATGIAVNDRRVLLIDANFYRPGLRAIYPNIPALGLSELLQGKATLSQTIVTTTDLPTLSVMGTGARPMATGAELLESKTFMDLLTQLKASYDVVIFDGAPLNLVQDSISLASRVNGVLGVVRAGATSRGTVQRVRDQLRQVNANLLGLVLNAAQTHGSGYFKENYKTFYKYANGAEVSTTPVAAGSK